MTDIDKIIDGKLEMLKASCEQAINDGNADESFLTALRLAYEEIIAALRCSEPDEIAEFQQSVYTLCEKFYPEVDGAGSDTGDWRDFTLAEIRQTLNHVAERQPSSDQVGFEEYHDGIIGVFKMNSDGSRNLKILTPQASEQFRAMLSAAEAEEKS